MNEKVLCEKSDLVAIADAVREATGSAENYNVEGLRIAATSIISSGGVASVSADWNENDPSSPSYVQNRTHYEAPPTFDISWDGVIGDRFALDMTSLGYEGIYCVKVDDRIFTVEEMFGATIETNDGTSDVVFPENCNSYTYPGVYNVGGCIIVVYAQERINEALGLPDGLITNGVYFYANPASELFVSHFVGKENSKKLDVKYLPEGCPYISEPKFNIIWDGNMEGKTSLDMSALGYEGFYFVKVSDDVISIDDAIGSIYCWTEAGESEIYDYSIDSTTYPGAYTINNEIVVVHTQDQINEALGLPDGYLTNGVYFASNPTNQMYVARFTGTTEIKKIDERYLPDIYSKAEVDDKISTAITGAIGGSY